MKHLADYFCHGFCRRVGFPLGPATHSAPGCFPPTPRRRVASKSELNPPPRRYLKPKDTFSSSALRVIDFLMYRSRHFFFAGVEWRWELSPRATASKTLFEILGKLYALRFYVKKKRSLGSRSVISIRQNTLSLGCVSGSGLWTEPCDFFCFCLYGLGTSRAGSGAATHLPETAAPGVMSRL